MNWPGDFLKQTGDFMSDVIKPRCKKLPIMNPPAAKNWLHEHHIY